MHSTTPPVTMPAESTYIPIPQTKLEAECLIKVGRHWLDRHDRAPRVDDSACAASVSVQYAQQETARFRELFQAEAERTGKLFKELMAVRKQLREETEALNAERSKSARLTCQITGIEIREDRFEKLAAAATEENVRFDQKQKQDIESLQQQVCQYQTLIDEAPTYFHPGYDFDGKKLEWLKRACLTEPKRATPPEPEFVPIIGAVTSVARVFGPEGTIATVTGTLLAKGDQDWQPYAKDTYLYFKKA